MDIKKLNDHILRGYISAIKHPVFDLQILNYTRKTSQKAFWNEETLNSRGLILDSNNTIISRPFRKFFEYEQLLDRYKPSNDILHEVNTKLDGTMGILYWNQNAPYLSTRGVFDSYQALIGNKILYQKYKTHFDWFDRKFTYIFEIISKEARNIVDYFDIEDIFLIGCIDTLSGEEIDIYSLENCPFPLPEKIEISFDDIFELEGSNQEGYIIKYANGFKIKVKFDSYRKRHNLYSRYRIKIMNMILNEEKSHQLPHKNSLPLEDRKYIEYIYGKGMNLMRCLKSPNEHCIPKRVKEKLESHDLEYVFKGQFLSAQFFSLNEEIFSFKKMQ